MTPSNYADERLQLAHEYQIAGDELARIKVKKATEILLLRARVKSDIQAERLWSATEDGFKEITLTYKLKGLEKLISAIKTKIEVLNNEMRNQY